jgi:hypothetical protein
MTLKALSAHVVIWESCWEPKVCVHLPWPWNRDECVSARFCVRLLQEDAKVILELEALGGRSQFDLANTCFPALEAGIARLEVCISNLIMVGGFPKSLHLTVKGCIGTKIGPIPVGQCWDLYAGDLSLSTFPLESFHVFGVMSEGDQTGLRTLVLESKETSHFSRLSGAVRCGRS